MEFKEIRKEVLRQIGDRYILNMESQDKLNKELSFYGKKYKGDFETQKTKLLKYVTNKKEKEIQEEFNFIRSIEEADDFSIHLTITIEWTKSRMWGSNPKAYTNFGFESESIGGCGYCKLSTATAQALNSHLPLLKALYLKEENRLRELNKSKLSKEDKEKYLCRRTFIGYGSGHYALPKFEGGVGVSSHESICERLGLKMRCITSTDKTDVYEVTKN